jgi:hypothetical protein
MSLYIGIYTFRGWWLKHGFTFERIRQTELPHGQQLIGIIFNRRDPLAKHKYKTNEMAK